MTQLEEMKNYIKKLANNGVLYFTKQKLVNEFDVDERIARKAISEVGKEDMKYFYMPSKKPGYYTLAKQAPSEMVNIFARKLLKTMKTIYFNKYKPLKDYITDQQLKELMTELELVFTEREEDGQR